ncbi:MAG: GAF domain-containing protein [Thermoleophilia bacterium]
MAKAGLLDEIFSKLDRCRHENLPFFDREEGGETVLLNVQRASLRLGVAPQTVRRWTSSGLLPCSRTPGGHRRIRQEDVDDLARQIGAGGNQLVARRARERELETLLETSLALVSQLELGDLLQEIARRLTRLMDCHFCALSALDDGAETVTTLAEYDDRGRRLPDFAPYHLAQFPLTRRVLEEQVTAVVNASDSAADPSELRQLAKDGDKSLLLVPLVYRGRAIGLLELADHLRERRYSRQELRICGAIAGQAAVALHNADAFSAAHVAERESDVLRQRLEQLSAEITGIATGDRVDVVLRRAATIACRVFAGVSCVASGAGKSGGYAAPHLGGTGGEQLAATAGAEVLVARDPSGRSDVQLVLSLTEKPPFGSAALLRLLAAVTGSAVVRQAAAGEVENDRD